MHTQQFYGIQLDGTQRYYNVNKLTLEFDGYGKLTPAEQQDTIITHDQFYDNPKNSSIHYAEESMPFKQGSEIIILGHVNPGKAETIARVTIKFAQHRWEKALRVMGKRQWRKQFFGIKASKADILSTPLSIRYEYAFGGKISAINPVGLGCFTKECRIDDKAAPQIELYNMPTVSPYQAQTAAGFNAIARHWQPRLGLYPQRHKQLTTYPDMHNVAPLDQRFEQQFIGGEEIILSGMRLQHGEDKTICLTLPKYHQQQWDTCIINMDSQKVILINRRAILL